MKLRKGQRGQAALEFAVAAPVALALIAMIFLAFMYMWRTANADWGLFASGVATGSYNGPKSAVPMRGVWDDLRPAFSWGQEGKSVSAHVGFHRRVSGYRGIALMEIHRGKVYFRLTDETQWATRSSHSRDRFAGRGDVSGGNAGADRRAAAQGAHGGGLRGIRLHPVHHPIPQPAR